MNEEANRQPEVHIPPPAQPESGGPSPEVKYRIADRHAAPATESAAAANETANPSETPEEFFARMIPIRRDKAKREFERKFSTKFGKDGFKCEVEAPNDAHPAEFNVIITAPENKTFPHTRLAEIGFSTRKNALVKAITLSKSDFTPMKFKQENATDWIVPWEVLMNRFPQVWNGKDWIALKTEDFGGNTYFNATNYLTSTLRANKYPDPQTPVDPSQPVPAAFEFPELAKARVQYKLGDQHFRITDVAPNFAPESVFQAAHCQQITFEHSPSRSVIHIPESVMCDICKPGLAK